MTPPDTYAEIRRGGMADLSARAKFHFTGEDRVRFLNGQVSNDVRRASESEALHACVMSPKGKMSGDIYVSAGPDFLRVDADPSLREDLAARLERYIISDDVTLLDVTAETCLIHLFGVERPPEVAGRSAVSVLRASRLGVEGFDLVMGREVFPGVWEALAGELPVAGEEMLEVLRVEAGVPRWGRELTAETIPVEAGLDRTSIDYAKGCYVGQEIISRLKSIGSVNKQLRGFLSSGGPLEAGMRLHAGDSAGKEAGWLTSAVYSFGLERYAALGYLKRGFDHESLWASPPGPHPGEEASRRVAVRSLPFIRSNE